MIDTSDEAGFPKNVLCGFRQKSFQGRPGCAPLAALPLADELHRNIEMTRQNGLTDPHRPYLCGNAEVGEAEVGGAWPLVKPAVLRVPAPRGIFQDPRGS